MWTLCHMVAARRAPLDKHFSLTLTMVKTIGVPIRADPVFCVRHDHSSSPYERGQQVPASLSSVLLVALRNRLGKLPLRAALRPILDEGGQLLSYQPIMNTGYFSARGSMVNITLRLCSLIGHTDLLIVDCPKGTCQKIPIFKPVPPTSKKEIRKNHLAVVCCEYRYDYNKTHRFGWRIILRIMITFCCCLFI